MKFFTTMREMTFIKVNFFEQFITVITNLKMVVTFKSGSNILKVVVVCCVHAYCHLLISIGMFLIKFVTFTIATLDP